MLSTKASTKKRLLESSTHLRPTRSASGPAMKGATRAPIAMSEDIKASSSDVIGLSRGESEVSLLFSFGKMGEVQPRQVPTTKADKLANNQRRVNLSNVATMMSTTHLPQQPERCDPSSLVPCCGISCRSSGRSLLLRKTVHVSLPAGCSLLAYGLLTCSSCNGSRVQAFK